MTYGAFVLAVVGIGVCGVANAGRPQASQRLTFEAASIKRSTAAHDNTSRNMGAGGRLVFENFTLKQLVTAAYEVEDVHVVGGPEWVDTDRFDVTATAGRPLPLPQLYQMLRTQLAERFRLIVHRESRDMPAYVLVRARAGGRLGPGLKRSLTDCGPTGRGRGALPAPDAPATLPAGCAAWISPTRVDFAGQPIANLVQALAMQLDRPVLDSTGLTGAYDIDLSFAPEGGRGGLLGPSAGGSTAPPSDPNAASVFTALQEQLGLKLESRRLPIDIIVIDRAEPPSEN